jgi:hypothetical protein
VFRFFCIRLSKIMLGSWDRDFILLVIFLFWWQSQDSPAFGCVLDGRSVIPDNSKE